MHICLVNEYGTSKKLVKRVKKFVEKDSLNWSGLGSHLSTNSFHSNWLQAKKQSWEGLSSRSTALISHQKGPRTTS